MNSILSRRQFMAQTAGLLLLPSARLARAYEANARLRLAVFGAMYNSEHFLYASHIHNADVVAICNPDQRKIPGILKRWGETATQLENANDPKHRPAAARYRSMAQGENVKVYADLRRMFDEMSDSIDALVVSDYDHFHGVACGPALRAGKPVCSERPLGLTLSDARTLRALAAASKVPTTYRSPGTGTGPFRRALEMVEDGLIGTVREAHIWFKRGGPDRDKRPEGQPTVPEGLNWDLWLGPLPWREYHPDWMAYSHWRETSNGGLGSFGPHTSIFPFLTLKLRSLWNESDGHTPIRVTAECSRLNRISFPRWERVRWEIPARPVSNPPAGDLREMPPVTITWHHGPEFAPGTRELIHERLRQFGVAAPADADALIREAGSILVGSEGALVADDHSVRVTALPTAKFRQIETNRPLRLPASQGIYGDWIDACRGGKSHILANFDHGGTLSELLMLGNIATQFPGETLSYDPAAGRITNHSEANRHFAIPYRAGWQI